MWPLFRKIEIPNIEISDCCNMGLSKCQSIKTSQYRKKNDRRVNNDVSYNMKRR